MCQCEREAIVDIALLADALPEPQKPTANRQWVAQMLARLSDEEVWRVGRFIQSRWPEAS